MVMIHRIDRWVDRELGIRCDSGFRQRDADQAIPGGNLGQLVFAPALSAFGPHRQYNEPGFLVRVFHSDFHVRGELQAELGEYLPRPANQAPTIIRGPIPLW